MGQQSTAASGRRDRVVVILPTYNECENIRSLLDAIFEQTGRIGDAELSVLVVDDQSPDGTGGLVREYAGRNPRVCLLESARKRGLGIAYKRGMAHALEEMGADIVFEMDADFSHDPNDIPRLLARARNGHDFVIGSRYVAGGSIPTNWSALRRVASRWGNVFARYIAGLRAVRDCTSGFRAIKADVLRQIALDGLDATGYVFQIRLLHEALTKGAKVSEIPIAFTDRVRGESKLGLKDVAEFMVKVFLIGFSCDRTKKG